MFKSISTYQELIDKLLEDKSLSKQQLAIDMGLGLKTIYNLQEGKEPALPTIQKINDYLRGKFNMEIKEKDKGITVIKSQSINYGKTYSGSTHNELSSFIIESLKQCQEELKQLREENFSLRLENEKLKAVLEES